MPRILPSMPPAVARGLAFTAGAVILWLIFCVQLFVNVAPLTVHRTDAVIMLGGASAERLPVARRLKQELGAQVLVLSHTDTPGNKLADAVCNSAQFPRQNLVCFRPKEYDTRGEAEVIGELVKRNGWKSITVVTSSYHVTRAGRLMEQCTTADVQMVPSQPDFSVGEWLRRFVIETGGFLDVSIRPECAGKSK